MKISVKIPLRLEAFFHCMLGSEYRWRSGPHEYPAEGAAPGETVRKGRIAEGAGDPRSRPLDVLANTRRLSRANPKGPRSAKGSAIPFAIDSLRIADLGSPSDWRSHAIPSIRGASCEP